MIRVLGFGAPQTMAGGRTLRPARLFVRSSLPASTACQIANGARERLGSLLAAEVETEVTEPAILGAAARDAVFTGAAVTRVRGHGCDAFVILRAAHARRLVAAAFGERERTEGALSPIEAQTLERIGAALAALCAPLCGAVRSVTPETAQRASLEAETYFEVRTSGRVHAALGFALTRDPAESAGDPLTLDDVADVEIGCRVEFARGALDAGRFAQLAARSTLLLDTRVGAEGVFFAGDVPLVRGTCGARDGRAAFAA